MSLHSQSLPLEQLLRATGVVAQERAWQDFVSEYSRLLLHVCRSHAESYDSAAESYDAAMDRYTYVLEQLRADDFRRLRGYAGDGRSRFTTWLVVVARRLCVDADRRRFGRVRGSPAEAKQRRELAELVGSGMDLDQLPDESTGHVGEALLAREVHEALATAVAGLAPSERLMLRLRFEDEATVAEIARVLSLPSVFHVYRRLNRIYDLLRAELRRLGVEDARY